MSAGEEGALAHRGPADEAPSLLLLRPGTQMPPIYMAPGIGDSAAGLFRLASHIHVANPIYAFQIQGFDGLTKPHERIQEMAEFHLSGLRQLQPHGPYFLIGYSLGGLLMLEIARRLGQTGEKIALLAMLDTYPHRRFLRFGPRVRLTARLALRRIARILRHSRAEQNPAANSSPAKDQEPNAQSWQRVTDAQNRAWREYHPQFYDGDVKYVRAAIPTFFSADPIPIWSHLVRTLHVETVPGAHLEMLTTGVEAVAAVVTRYIEEARSSFLQ